MNKIVFLDIDGTLVDYERDMPESTKRALILAKELILHYAQEEQFQIFIHFY